LRAKHYELEQSYDDTLEALGTALDMKDAETQGHCQRVTAFTNSIAKAVSVPLNYLPILARAAFLHDIGKMAIPASILRKPGPLDNDEKQIMRPCPWRIANLGHNPRFIALWCIENTGFCFPQNAEPGRDRKAQARI
jgi:response regulator RpfG family c-di-GMP phosphodiesterase